jgi:photosystem II stability/assembly factor-like uncharacterized protein
MKKQFALCCLLFLFAFALQSCSSKKESDPQPTAASLLSKDKRVSGFSWTKSTVSGNWLSSSFVDQYTGFITGLSGAMVKTTDGGATYTPITGLPLQHLYVCYFQTNMNGFIAGDNNTALRTTDGGVTWTALSLPTLPTVHFRNIYFFNSSVGFLTGGAGTILKTIDGGTTWQLANGGVSPNAAIYSMYFYDQNEGLAGSNYGGVYKTTNGGKSWTLNTVHDSRANISSMAYLSTNDSLYATTSISNSSPSDPITYLVTGNRGANWYKATIPGAYQVLASVKVTPGAIYMAGGNVANNTGVIYSNSPSGLAPVTIPASGRFMCLSLVTYSPGNAVLFAGGLNNTIIKGQ